MFARKKSLGLEEYINMSDFDSNPFADPEAVNPFSVSFFDLSKNRCCSKFSSTKINIKQIHMLL